MLIASFKKIIYIPEKNKQKFKFDLKNLIVSKMYVGKISKLISDKIDFLKIHSY